ncbi:MAG: hypothetical protein NUV97_03730 [archaeon]|nr:hypothetical protein [archaeon]MCR4323872.1 hypothetical protein [Nanoarchaeota archaeon]
MKNKNGMIGLLPIWLIFTLLIVVILIFFVMVSSMIKTLDDANSGVKVLKERAIGLQKVEPYVQKEYLQLTQIKFLSKSTNKSLNEIILEVTHEKQ